MRKLPYWLEEYTPAESVDIMRTLALTHAEQGGAVGLEIIRMIRRDDVRSLCEYSINYEDARFESVGQIAHCRQALALFSKLKHLKIGVDKELVALNSWWEAEEHCVRTNALFKMRARGEFQFSPRVESVIRKAQRKIARVLGRIPKFSELQYRFGPGATVATKKKDANAREKLQAGIQCSEDLFPYAKALLEEMPLLASLHSIQDRVDEDGEEWMRIPIDVVYGRLDFVPKNAKTDRITVIEPILNSMFQLAVGDHLMTRLRAFGLNLRDQTINQDLAREGSLSGDLATLDLKSASDTVALELVYALLPLEWAAFLARGRSSKIVLPNGTVHCQAKFSSMGNGYTFPLESLIFWALTESACPPRSTVNVFGDDIVCPTNAVPLVKEVLCACGFWVNEGKSYVTGPFRESCGRDFYLGIDIRPYYQKDWVSGRTLFLLHNFYVRKGDIARADLVLSWIHPSLQLLGPDGYGDGHLIREFVPFRKASHHRAGYGGYIFRTYTVKARRDLRPVQPGDYVLPQYSVYRRGSTPIVDFGALLASGRPGRVPALARSKFRAELGLEIVEPSSQIADHVCEDGEVIKALTLPGDDGYKMISIYTLGV